LQAVAALLSFIRQLSAKLFKQVFLFDVVHSQYK
jgi:hypothetical protein